RKPLYRRDDDSPLILLPPEIVGHIAGYGAEFHGFSALQKYCKGNEHLFWKGVVARIGCLTVHLEGNNYRKVVKDFCRSFQNLNSPAYDLMVYMSESGRIQELAREHLKSVPRQLTTVDAVLLLQNKCWGINCSAHWSILLRVPGLEALAEPAY